MSLLSSDLRPTEISIVVVLIASLVLLPPLLDLWFSLDSPWYLPCQTRLAGQAVSDWKTGILTLRVVDFRKVSIRISLCIQCRHSRMLASWHGFGTAAEFLEKLGRIP